MSVLRPSPSNCQPWNGHVMQRRPVVARLDGAAVAEMGAQVGAEGVLDVDAVVAPPDHEVAAEVVAGDGLAGGEVVGVGDAEPAERDRERVVAHQLSSIPRTRAALWRRNFGHTSSLNPTLGSSEKIRSSERPIGK